MTDPDQSKQSDTAPTPVIQLAYLDHQGEPWLPMVKLVSWTIVVAYGSAALGWLAMYGCYVVQNSLNRPPRALRPELIFTELLTAIAALISAVAALGCLRLREPSRSTLVSTARVMVVVVPLTYLAVAVQYVSTIGLAGDALGAVAFGVRYSLAAVGGVAVPLLVIRVFNRAEVRSLFR